MVESLILDEASQKVNVAADRHYRGGNHQCMSFDGYLAVGDATGVKGWQRGLHPVLLVTRANAETVWGCIRRVSWAGTASETSACLSSGVATTVGFQRAGVCDAPGAHR